MYEFTFYHENKKYLFTELTANYVQQTAQLLNQEWPRSQCQRVLSLQEYLGEEKLKFPVSLIIVDCETDQVVGHATLTAITTASDLTQHLVFIQSVVIDPTLRGKGLGKKLMIETEKYIVEFSRQPQNGLVRTNCEYSYLNTKDKQRFYEGLGYQRIEPILFYANKNTKCNMIMKNLLQSMASQTTQTTPQQIQKQLVKESLTSFDAPVTDPPPPPPIPIINLKCNNNEASNEDVTWFKKKLL